MSPRARRWLVAVLTVALLHALVGRLLAGADFMGALAAARHGQLGVAAAFGVFLALRLTATLLVPAGCIAWAALVGWDALRTHIRA
jgi:hypothetical protein